MDKALKQRLVGAVVLIALAVIVLPMILGGRSPSNQSASRSIELPAQPPDLEFETRRFPVGDEQNLGPGAGLPSGEPEIDIPERTLVAPPAESDITESADEAELAEEGLEQGIDDDSAGMASAADSQPSDEPATDASPDTDGMEALVENLMASDGTASRMSSSMRYVVQVASFGSPANAARLAGQLEASGYAVLQDQVSSETGQLNRVRVGPFASEAEAQQIATTLTEAYEGINPRIVDMQPNEAGPAIASEDPLMRWVVQVGSFASQDNALELVQRLRSSGLSAYEETVRTDSATIHRVRVGPFLDRGDALAAEQKIT
ncbi:MAG: SPOR domain-containing protein, partial [Xanthomonadales bacterium]|nr:SPOR domain-containing protein [Xanthomonadales bacterium]